MDLNTALPPLFPTTPPLFLPPNLTPLAPPPGTLGLYVEKINNSATPGGGGLMPDYVHRGRAGAQGEGGGAGGGFFNGSVTSLFEVAFHPFFVSLSWEHHSNSSVSMSFLSLSISAPPPSNCPLFSLPPALATYSRSARACTSH
jgi:hypothetical protein